MTKYSMINLDTVIEALEYFSDTKNYTHISTNGQALAGFPCDKINTAKAALAELQAYIETQIKV